MKTLGDKNIKNTLIYVQLAEGLFKDQQEYVSKVAKTEIDICAVVDAGFEFVCEHKEAKIFRKRKYPLDKPPDTLPINGAGGKI